jgi:hypothetical protein
MKSVLVRIGLRYVSGALVTKGLLDPSFGDFIATDPEVAQAIYLIAGAAVGAASEIGYVAAKRLGWAT